MLRLLILVGVLAGCTPYWVKVAPPTRVERIELVEYPCGDASLYGCAQLNTGVIQVRIGLSTELTSCIVAHEKKHFDGYTHHNRTHYAVDCGDGRMWIPHV